MSKKKVLLQLDPDPQPSSFDAVTAIDAGVDHVLQYGAVEPTQVRQLVYGAIFTRGPDQLRNTAIFVGGSDASAGEALLRQVVETCFDPMRVSVLFDANGSNTTAAAAVLAAEKHVALAGATALVLGATGPVGQRSARLLAKAGATVRVGSRSLQRAEEVCRELRAKAPEAELKPVQTANAEETRQALDGASVAIAAGAPQVTLIPRDARQGCDDLKVLIDLNAAPPLGVEGVETSDRGEERDGIFCYGAIGVGADKMRVHKAALRSLFEQNDRVLDAEEIFELARTLAK